MSKDSDERFEMWRYRHRIADDIKGTAEEQWAKAAWDEQQTVIEYYREEAQGVECDRDIERRILIDTVVSISRRCK